ncbi:hypothetical protein [Streptomyces sp. NPDC001100]
MEPHEYALDRPAFMRDIEKRQWSAHFYGRLKDVRCAEMQARISRGVADGWEHQAIDFVPFRTSTVIKYMLRADRIHRWVAAQIIRRIP